MIHDLRRPGTLALASLYALREMKSVETIHARLDVVIPEIERILRATSEKWSMETDASTPVGNSAAVAAKHGTSDEGQGLVVRVAIVDDDEFYAGILKEQFEAASDSTGEGRIGVDVKVFERYPPENSILGEIVDIVICDGWVGDGGPSDTVLFVKRLRHNGFRGIFCVHTNDQAPYDLREEEGVNLVIVKPMTKLQARELIENAMKIAKR
jgi:hypothetical protein